MRAEISKAADATTRELAAAEYQAYANQIRVHSARQKNPATKYKIAIAARKPPIAARKLPIAARKLLLPVEWKNTIVSTILKNAAASKNESRLHDSAVRRRARIHPRSPGVAILSSGKGNFSPQDE
jgi:hypothetical protein